MTFLSPAVLALGAVLALIPLIIYLIFLRRYTPVKWGAMEILRRALRKHARRTKLQDLILLALRTLVLLLLGLAFARPLGSALASQFGGKSLHVMVIDNTLSMACRDAGLSRFDEARDHASDLVRRLPGNARMLVLPLVAGDPAEATVTEDRGVAERLISAIPMVDHGRGVRETLDALNDFLTGAGGAAARVAILTDGQESTWTGDAGVAEALRRLAAQAELRVLTVSPDSAVNRRVRPVLVEGLPATVDRPVSFRVEVDGGAGSAGQEIPLSLSVDGSVVDRRFPRLEAEGRVQAEFRRVFREPGFYRIAIATDEDDLLADNTAWFALAVSESIPVLLIEDKSPAATYLAAAFDPGTLGQEGSPYRVTRIRPADAGREDLNRYDLVVVSDLAELDTQERARLFAWVESGGSALCLVRGDAPLPSETGVALAAPLRTQEGQPPLQYRVDDVSPSLSRIAANASLRRDLDGIRTTWTRVFTVAAESPAQTLLTTAEGAAVLVESALGTGRVLWWGMSLVPDESDLPLKPTFVALIHETARRLTGAGKTPALTAGEPWIGGVGRNEAGGGLTLAGPSGSRAINETWLKASGTNSVMALETPPLHHAGHWTLESVSLRRPLRMAAVNPPEAESDLRFLDAAGWDEASGGDVRVWPAGDYLAAGYASDRPGGELTGLLLLAALILAAVESWLVWQFGGAPALVKAPEGRRA